MNNTRVLHSLTLEDLKTAEFALKKILRTNSFNDEMQVKHQACLNRFTETVIECEIELSSKVKPDRSF